MKAKFRETNPGGNRVGILLLCQVENTGRGSWKTQKQISAACNHKTNLIVIVIEKSKHSQCEDPPLLESRSQIDNNSDLLLTRPTLNESTFHETSEFSKMDPFLIKSPSL